MSATITDRTFMEDAEARNGWFIPAGSLTESAIASLEKLIARARHGGSADVVLRVDGIETRWEADWIKYTRRMPRP